MPIYPYICDTCGHTDIEFTTISQYQREVRCPMCNDDTMMRRDFAGKGPNTLDRPFRIPIEMYSVAPDTPAEVAAFRQRNPEVVLNDQLVPVAHTRAEKLRILQNEGYEEKN